MAEQRRDVIEILTHDHRELEAMFAELESLRGTTGAAECDRRADLVAQVASELLRHSAAEEATVYPAVMNKVSDAEAELARHEHAEAEAELARHEHAEAEASLKRLEGLQPDDAAFDSELETLIRGIRDHVAKEESEMFPHMRQVFTQEELDELGAKVESVKKVAPTLPAPSVPGQPPGRHA